MKKDDIIYGFQPVLEAIKSGKEIDKLFFLKTLHPLKLQEVKKLAIEYQIPFQFVPREKLDRITRQTHQGVIALTSPVSYVETSQILPILFESGKVPFLLILDKITDVRNIGSIARSAECAGVDALILPAKGSAMINADAIKTSAGALTRMLLSRTSSIRETIKFLKDSGLRVVGSRENSGTLYHETDYTVPLALIMGSEEKGIAEEHVSMCDEMVSIPLLGEIQSLNVAVAAGVVLFEAVRQRQNLDK